MDPDLRAVSILLSPPGRLGKAGTKFVCVLWVEGFLDEENRDYVELCYVSMTNGEQFIKNCRIVK